MPYPARLLNTEESVALDLNPHWWYFAESVSAFAVSGVLWLFVFGQEPRHWYFTYPVGVVALASAAWLLVRYLKWRTTYFVITSDRLIYRHGVIGKAGIEIPLERVNNVNFKQSIFERIIGAGDLLIESGGEEGQQRFTDISHPDKVQNLIHMQMEDNQVKILAQRYLAPALAVEVEAAPALSRKTFDRPWFTYVKACNWPLLSPKTQPE